MTHGQQHTTPIDKYPDKLTGVSILIWFIAFAVFLPGAKAGIVGDIPYLIDAAEKQSFWDFINIEEGTALYHTAALNFYVLIKLFGTNYWLWHLLYVTIHAINGLLLFVFMRNLLQHSTIKNAQLMSLTTAVLFVICPHASEVVIWEGSNHHAVATAIILSVLILVQKFHETPKTKYAVLALLLFLYSSFSHEFFYLTPWFTLLLIFYYRFALGYDKRVFKKSFLYFFVPLVLLFIGHLLLLRIVKHTYISHFGELEKMSVFFYLGKPLKYIFHVLFMGRFFSFETRHKIYTLCESKTAIITFYALLITYWGYVLLRIRQVNAKAKIIALMSVYALGVYFLLSPLDFADSLLVAYDRYVYPSTGFAFLIPVLLVSYIPVRTLQLSLISGYIMVNIWLTIKVNIYWKQSAYVIRQLLEGFPDTSDKKVLLLNLPDDLNGIPMISAQDDGRFKMMMNTLTPRKVNNRIYDVVAYKMSDISDGAHVNVVNDSTVRVTLNQWGTWWLYGLLGAGSYENADYKVNMTDPGHWYELTLKKPASEYLILYQVGSEWKTVDLGKKNTDQN